jgi:hypothetical protein
MASTFIDLHQHARADEYLTWLGLVAKARGDVGDRPDCAMAKSASKPIVRSVANS